MTVYKLKAPVDDTTVPVRATVAHAVYKGCFKASGNGAIPTDPVWTYSAMTNEVQKQLSIGCNALVVHQLQVEWCPCEAYIRE